MASPQPDKFTRISNELFDEYIKKSRFLSPYENAVWFCILRKTYGWNKKEDWISLKQIEDITGIRQPHVARTKKKLLSKNMITVKCNKLSINKDYEKWIYPNRYTQTGIPKQDIPEQVIKHTQTGNTNIPEQVIEGIPKQVDTKDSIKDSIKETITKDMETVTAFHKFCNTYEQKFEKKYIAQFGKDNTLIKDLLKIIPLEELMILIDKFFNSNDKFILDSGYTIGVFKSQINKLRIGGQNGITQGNNQPDTGKPGKYAHLSRELNQM